MHSHTYNKNFRLFILPKIHGERIIHFAFLHILTCKHGQFMFFIHIRKLVTSPINYFVQRYEIVAHHELWSAYVFSSVIYNFFSGCKKKSAAVRKIFWDLTQIKLTLFDESEYFLNQYFTQTKCNKANSQFGVLGTKFAMLEFPKEYL